MKFWRYLSLVFLVVSCASVKIDTRKIKKVSAQHYKNSLMLPLLAYVKCTNLKGGKDAVGTIHYSLKIQNDQFSVSDFSIDLFGKKTNENCASRLSALSSEMLDDLTEKYTEHAGIELKKMYVDTVKLEIYFLEGKNPTGFTTPARGEVSYKETNIKSSNYLSSDVDVFGEYAKAHLIGKTMGSIFSALIIK